MKAVDKAKELVDRFYGIEPVEPIYIGMDKGQAKQCALICVDEIVQVLWHNHEKNSEKMYRYYIEVKQEIERL